MLIRDTIHKFGACGATINLHKVGAIAVMTPEGVIDTEKSRPIKEGGPKPDPSNVAAALLAIPRYKKLETKKITSPKPAPKPPAKPAPAPKPEEAAMPDDNGAGSEASAPPPASTTAPPAPAASPTPLPATPQTGDRETLDEVMLAKDSGDLKVHEVEAALNTNLVPLAKAEKWLKQEKKGKKRKTLINVLKDYLDDNEIQEG